MTVGVSRYRNVESWLLVFDANGLNFHYTSCGIYHQGLFTFTAKSLDDPTRVCTCGHDAMIEALRGSRLVQSMLAEVAPSNVMTIREVARYKHCHYQTVHRAIKDGRLRATMVGNAWVMTVADVNRWNPYALSEGRAL